MEKFDELVTTLAEKTGQKEEHIKYALYGVIVLILFCGLGGSIISKLVGFFYPAFESLKALESKKGSDDKKWLTYWVVFGLITLLEHIISPVFALVPFYFFIKMIFYIWLYIPQTNGAELIHDKFVHPYFKKYEA